jgi:hypothetical protein
LRSRAQANCRRVRPTTASDSVASTKDIVELPFQLLTSC